MKQKLIFTLSILLFLSFDTSCQISKQKEKTMDIKSKNTKDIYFAGGCFWGLEKYFSLVDGVLQTDVGYANGKTTSPTYEEVCYNNTGHAETVHLVYDTEKISLPFLLSLFFDVIDPTSLNKQGNDVGTQYRTGIYFINKEDEKVANDFIDNIQKSYKEKIQVEVLPLDNYSKAEEYHQNYLEKNPFGYCHIGFDKFQKAKTATDNSMNKTANNKDNLPYTRPSNEQLKETLTPLQYSVAVEAATETAFKNEFWDSKEVGLYVDIATGQPLFLSTDKFDSGCGWPSFSKPITEEVITEKEDYSYGMERTEVRSQIGDIHLGHVFDDGPKELGGLRYCINSASLRFIPKDKLEEEGYGEYIKLLEK